MTVVEPLKAPFPYFGGKRGVVDQVWRAFGNTPNYIEPFAGSLAVLLARPHDAKVETVNDTDGLLVNAWRAIKAAPDDVADLVDYPTSELDLTARHLRLVAQRDSLTARLEADPDYCDVRLGAWWVWGACCWIGSGWCSGDGPWTLIDGEVRKLPHLGDAGRGVNRKLPHLGDAAQQLTADTPTELHTWMRQLATRLRKTRITCGDFQRVLTPSVTTRHGTTSVFLDPPYDHDGDRSMYQHGDASKRARDWAAANGNTPQFRIIICGYGDEHAELESLGWTRQAWAARKGYQVADDDGHHSGRNEAIWLSPHCHRQPTLFEEAS